MSTLKVTDHVLLRPLRPHEAHILPKRGIVLHVEDSLATVLWDGEELGEELESNRLELVESD